jgi:hypothetical protein
MRQKLVLWFQSGEAGRFSPQLLSSDNESSRTVNMSGVEQTC